MPPTARIYCASFAVGGYSNSRQRTEPWRPERSSVKGIGIRFHRGRSRSRSARSRSEGTYIVKGGHGRWSVAVCTYQVCVTCKSPRDTSGQGINCCWQQDAGQMVPVIPTRSTPISIVRFDVGRLDGIAFFLNGTETDENSKAGSS